MIPTLIRLILSIALLWLAWLHSHWSVALTLTLLCLRAEIDTLVRQAKKERAL